MRTESEFAFWSTRLPHAGNLEYHRVPRRSSLVQLTSIVLKRWTIIFRLASCGHAQAIRKFSTLSCSRQPERVDGPPHECLPLVGVCWRQRQRFNGTAVGDRSVPALIRADTGTTVLMTENTLQLLRFHADIV